MAKRKEIREIITVYKQSKGNVSLTANTLKISRSTVYRWLKRCQSLYTPGYLKWKGIKRKSTRPKTIHKALTPQQEALVIETREKNGFDSRKIALELKLKNDIIVSASTVYRLIKAKKPSLLRKISNYRRPRFQNGKAMRPRNTKTIGYLQADVKYVTPELSGLPYTTYEYAFIDIFSRYKLALILPILDETGSIVTLKWVIKEMPFKIEYLQTDNGLEFQSQFHRFCEENDINHYWIHKNSPNENAVIERSFRTDEEEFFFNLKREPKNINELNTWFQNYLIWYNNERPHFGIGLKTPLEVIESVSKILKH